ncbi:TerC family protein [Massilia norwichensis]|uniref:TerC family protein n=1 Tax=Massilia norwichensis TaxID=1442366 RepID=A0ABT2A8H0_9BURK|nr:TerC family protein [Massilia norwichensis]MCS0590428.1 TerC family protein [Massilia norwichensis]
MPASIGTPGLYASFTVLVICLLAVDFFMLKKEGSHTVSTREAAAWSVVWVTIALAFGALFWWYLDGTVGPDVARARALEYFTGYLIEKSLAVDNVFVWITLFNFFAVPAALQKRVLLYGVLGAIVMRALLIWLGALLLARFHWILYLFGLLLLVTGVKMLLFASHESDLAQNPVLRWMRGHMRIADEFHGERFFVVQQGLRYATPLFVVLVLVEVTDLIFAVDSIPAIFAVTGDPFIVFTSNIFAILGLRAMYFLLADMAQRFHLLKYGLAGILIFIGAKMLLLDVYKIPVGVAQGVVGLILALSVVASLLTSKPVQRT